MPHRHHKFNLGKAISSITKPVWHETKELINTPGEVVKDGMQIASNNMLPILIVGGLVAVMVLRK